MAGAIQTGTLKGATWGAVSAMAFYQIGSYFETAQWASEGTHVANSGLNAGGYAAKLLAHGVTGGALQYAQGGKFGSGFAAAGVTQAVGGYVDVLDPSNPGFSSQRVIAAALIGGSVSDMTGGKFAHGAVTAAFSRAFNEEVTWSSKIAALRRRYPAVSRESIDVAYGWLAEHNANSAYVRGQKLVEYGTEMNGKAGSLATGPLRTGSDGNVPWELSRANTQALAHTHGYGGSWINDFFSSNDVDAASVLGRPIPVFLSTPDGAFRVFFPGMPIGGRPGGSTIRLPSGAAEGFELCGSCVPTRSSR